MARPENTEDMIPNLPLSSLHSYVGEIMKSPSMDNTRERMKNEWARYISFGTFPRSCSVQPTRLAQSGFYYSGTGDQTICFSCGLNCKNWKEGDSPFDVHMRLSPNCNFVNGIQDDNIPIRNRVTKIVPHTNSATAFEVQEEKVTYGFIGSENKNESRVLSVIQTNVSSDVDRTGEKEHSANTLGTRNSESPSNSIYTCSPSAQVEKKETYNTRNILSERFNRQQEQIHNDVKVAERLVNSNETNGSIGSNAMTNELVISKSVQVKQQSSSNRNNALGVCLEKPKHPHYSILTSRLESFRGWPSHMKQKPADLATAGFYYAGVGDCVRCFFCGGGLRSWEEGDDIWEEHARWYPDCAFLKQCKGEDFVLRQLAGINLRSNETLETELRESAASEKSSQKELCHVPLGFEAREVLPEDPMDYPSTQSVLSIGYNTEMVKKAVQMLISKNGHSKFSSTELMEVIFELEENESNLHVSENTDPINDMAQVPAEVTTQSTKDQNADGNKQSTSHLQHRNHVEEEKNNYSSQNCLSSKQMESLLEQNQELKDQMTCKICMENEACIVFLPCRHMMACPQCAPALIKCPICRQLVRGTVRAYIS